MPGPLSSLVKYDTPSLLTTKKGAKAGGKGGKKLPPVEAKQPLTQTEDILNSILPPRCACARGTRHRSAAPLRRCRPHPLSRCESLRSASTHAGRCAVAEPPRWQPAQLSLARSLSHASLALFLCACLARREWTEDGQLWVQYVSSTPATRLDVINLQEQLDQRLLQRQARETGICPVREELYAQCFDELIRQVTINCAERGLLLLRVRDEIRMTIAAYQTLYESSIAFGMRKALQAEQGKADMETRIKQLEAEKKELERQVQELKAKAEAIEKREGERRALEEKKHAEEVQFLKRTNAQLKKELETYLAPSKK